MTRNQHSPQYGAVDESGIYQACPKWKAASLTAAVKAISSSQSMLSEDTKILLIFLSFLSIPDKIPLDLLFRGGSPRKRWSEAGDIEQLNADHSDLAHELCVFLSDETRLQNSINESRSSSAILDSSDGTYTLNEATMSGISKKLTAEDASVWRSQVLVVTYRAIPWKYIESTTIQTKLLLPHLKHVLQTFPDFAQHLSASTRADLALTLIEASRFPTIAWKEFALNQVKVASDVVEDHYIQACFALSQCVFHRITGNMDQAASSLDPIQDITSMDRRMHSAIGYSAIQSSLNCIQVEDLSTAEALLDDWKPSDEHPSLLEQTVMFRKHMILGRILRFKGSFRESLMHLAKAQEMVKRHDKLNFDEDLRDFICDQADTLRELDEPETAERLLREEIDRRDRDCIPGNTYRLKLTLAEAVFAQKRLDEVERICLGVKSQPGLLKLDNLRLQITMAKIRDSKCDKKGALRYWIGAMKEVGKFHLTNGYTTRIIILSIRDSLSGTEEAEMMESTSLQQVNVLGENAKPGGTKYWIGGLDHWARSKGFDNILNIS
ncbi:Ff.00g054210.m01.CDS01 [Fusarium sp. VM40]|nr:Ff.00g054210.m01.CDS01 [Fusarium sp. VM40]